MELIWVIFCVFVGAAGGWLGNEIIPCSLFGLAIGLVSAKRVMKDIK